MVTFDNGDEGWKGPQGFGGMTFIDQNFGNPQPSLRTQFTDFGITFYNNTNPAFTGDFTSTMTAEISIDAYTTALNFLGLPTPREFIVELRDYDAPPAGYPYVSVWHSLGVLDENDPGWHIWGVTIDDTSATDLPPGWGGTGAEDPMTFEPMLPPDRTFASVLAGVDEMAFTTFVPGFFFADSFYDVAVDNITVERIPEPDTFALAAIASALLLRRFRRW
jgi:hypothetical protein